jgi:bifunctional DNA-binding transcriptional regulator/antitoxin component of YhaV-PrlF toxin-antitoxin module
MMWIAPVSSKGQVTLPLAVRQSFGISPVGGKILMERKKDFLFLKPAGGTLSSLRGILSSHPKAGMSWQKVKQLAEIQRARHIAANG